MKLLSDKWPVRWNDDTAFYGYRWFAWVLAGLALTFPGQESTNLPGASGLLLLLGVISVAATAMAQGYVRLARQRPWVLALDILAGLLVVWLSGGGTLPFLPYAFGALVLPALLFGWRGAVVAGAAFGLFDSAALLLESSFADSGLAPLTLGLRAVTPLLFGGCWVLAGRILTRYERSNDSAELQPGSVKLRPTPPGSASEQVVQMNAFADLKRSTGPGTGRHLGQPAHLLPISRSDATRHAIFDLVPGEDLSFSAALDQLRMSFSRQESVEIQLSRIGTAHALTGAQHSVLLRVAQEALMNIYQHAHARSVLITIAYEPEAVTLSVQDDGVGLLDGTYERPGMHALRAVRYRLAELDGQLAVFEGENGGVTLRATLPLN